MHIKWTVWCIFPTNNYRFICMHTKNIIGLIVSQFMYIHFRLILCRYNLDTMNSNNMIFNVIALGLQKNVLSWNWHDYAIESGTPQLCCIFLSYTVDTPNSIVSNLNRCSYILIHTKTIAHWHTSANESRLTGPLINLYFQIYIDTNRNIRIQTGTCIYIHTCHSQLDIRELTHKFNLAAVVQFLNPYTYLGWISFRSI